MNSTPRRVRTRPDRRGRGGHLRTRSLVGCAVVRGWAGRPYRLGGLIAAVEERADGGGRERLKGLGTASIHFHRELVALAGSERTDELMRSVFAELRLAFHVVDDPRRLHEPYLARSARSCRHCRRGTGAARNGCWRRYPRLAGARGGGVPAPGGRRAPLKRRGGRPAGPGRLRPDDAPRPYRPDRPSLSFGPMSDPGPSLCTVTSPASTDSVPPQLSAGPRPAPGPAADEGLARLAARARVHRAAARSWTRARPTWPASTRCTGWPRWRWPPSTWSR